MARKLVGLEVNFISLVHKGANRKSLLYKADDGSMMFEIPLTHLTKDAKEGIAYGCVYEPGVIDSQGDWTDAETIKTAAHDFLAKGKVQMVDTQHNFEPGAGVVVESFIKRGTHEHFPDVKDGAWCVGIRVSEAMKSAMDKIGGLSLAGRAASKEEAPGIEHMKSEDMPVAFVDRGQVAYVEKAVIGDRY